MLDFMSLALIFVFFALSFWTRKLPFNPSRLLPS